MNRGQLELVVQLLRAELENMHDSDRLDLFEDITKNYCTKCGTILYGTKIQCYCTRDD